MYDSKILSEIRERTANVEAKVDMVLENNKKVDEMKDIALDKWRKF